MTQTLPTPLAVGPGLSPDELERQALAAFDGSQPGEEVTVVAEATLRGLLARFQTERKGQFDWTPTREGPDTWQVEVSRRAADRGELRTVNQALSWDHDRLDALEASAFAARESSDPARAASLFSAFAFGLRRHIRFEEELLFPEFEAKAGIPATVGPTAVMRDEHLEILDWVGEIEAAIGDIARSTETLRAALHDVLGEHNLKEENIVYPGTDQVLTPLERDALVARIQAL